MMKACFCIVLFVHFFSSPCHICNPFSLIVCLGLFRVLVDRRCLECFVDVEDPLGQAGHRRNRSDRGGGDLKGTEPEFIND
jgi:hypothetical protein